MYKVIARQKQVKLIVTCWISCCRSNRSGGCRIIANMEKFYRGIIYTQLASILNSVISNSATCSCIKPDTITKRD